MNCVTLPQTFLLGTTCIYTTYTPNFLPFSKHATSSDCFFFFFLHMILLPRKASPISVPGVIPISLQILSNPNATSPILLDRVDFSFLFSYCIIKVLLTSYYNFLFAYLYCFFARNYTNLMT